MIKDNSEYAIECKSSLSQSLSKGNYNAMKDIKPEKFFVVSPVFEGWSMKPGIDVESHNEIESLITPPLRR